MDRLVVFILFSLTLFPYTTHAQKAMPGKGDAFSRLETHYRLAAGIDKRFINGSEYLDVFPGSIGHSFFLDGNWYLGELVMEGKRYNDIPLKYDLYRDQLLYNHIHPSGSYVIVLNKTRVDTFVIEGHLFCKFSLSDVPNGNPVSGRKEAFFEVVSRGAATFYQKWEKNYSEPTQHDGGSFSLHKDWYILNNNQYHRINRKYQLVRALGDREKEIRAYIRENRLILRPGDESTVKQVVDHYNSLL